jgi:hypothetical protein
VRAGATKFVRIRAIRVYFSETLARTENRKILRRVAKGNAARRIYVNLIAAARR